MATSRAQRRAAARGGTVPETDETTEYGAVLRAQAEEAPRGALHADAQGFRSGAWRGWKRRRR